MPVSSGDKREIRVPEAQTLGQNDRVEGVLIASASRSEKPLKLLTDRNVPAVLVDRVVDGFDVDIVRGDSYNGAMILTNHLIDRGHRHIALINGNLNTSPAMDRLAGYYEAMRRADIQVDPRLISSGTWFIEDADAPTERLIDQDTSITAIFGTNSFMSIGALRVLRRRKIRVPEDIALVSFDEVELAADIDPFLTVIAQPAYSMGTLAMKFLFERIGRKFQGPPREIVLTPRLTVRRSCGTSLGSLQPLPPAITSIEAASGIGDTNETEH